MQTSLMYGKYDRMIDRESAYEILTAQMEKALQVKEDTERQKVELKQQKEDLKLQKDIERQQRTAQIEKDRLAREKKRAHDQSIVGSLTKMAATKAKREAVNSVFKVGRGLLGSFLKGK
jgi:hypothetical protein